jgi:predicted nucleic acid-binding protein
VVLVDTNVLLDILEDDPEWASWSEDQLEAAAAIDTIVINPVIYSELSMAFARIEDLDAVVEEAGLKIEFIPKEALFLAGKVFLTYRQSRGTKLSVVPDFFIGAHAAVMRWPILTRDTSRYRTYFPSVELITP